MADDATALVTALKLLQQDAPGGVYGQPEGRPRWAPLPPHVLAATSHLPDELLGEGSASTCSWLLDRAGTCLQTQGRFREAVPLMRRALAIDERTHGPGGPDVAAAPGEDTAASGHVARAATIRAASREEGGGA